jgi:GT2 family glycosyltransferase
MNIGLATLWFKTSFDAILESYALYTLIEALGHKPELLAKPIGLKDDVHEPDNKLSREFFKNRCRSAKDSKTPADYAKLNKDFDGFVVGGGSVWDYENGGSSGQYFYLDFAQSNKKKIAYAPTFGDDKVIAVDDFDKAGRLLRKFDGVAVTNEDLADACAQRFKTQSDVVLSPLMTCGKDAFEKLVKVRVSEKGGFIACDFDIAASGDTKYRFALKASSHTDRALHILLKPLAYDADAAEGLSDAKILNSVEEYVGYLKSCDLLITDSFTSTCLAILFEKPFVVLAKEGEPDYANIHYLLHKLDLLKHLLSSDEPLTAENADSFFEEPDYKTVQKLIARERHLNTVWLKNALAGTLAGSGGFQPLKKRGKAETSADRSKYMIQRLLFPETEQMDEHWWMYYRGHKMALDQQQSCRLLPSLAHIEFFTYFNSLSLRKWMEYTNAERFFLHLKVKGEFNFRLFGHYLEGKEIKKETFDLQHFNQKEISEIIISVRSEKSSVVSFSLDALSDCEFYGGYYSVDVSDIKLNPVQLDIITTTFKKEDFVRNNVRQFEDELFTDEEIADHIFVNLIDNGRTLHADEFESEHLRVFSNPNVGGAGGFCRGMLETLHSSRKPTHVLLMDDDVLVLPESIKRTYKLLRLMKEEYQDHFISGAMLFLERMNIQHEDIGYVDKKSGAFLSQKPHFDITLWDSVVKNEENYDKENQYAAWWYCCIPIKFIREDNLPLPLFFRGDDVEFSLRNQAKVLSMNGICLWHMEFVPRYNDTVELWLTSRNSFFMQATSEISAQTDFLLRLQDLFWIEIRHFNYSGANMLLDALEDYLQGPEAFIQHGGAGTYLEHLEKNEKLQPVEELAVEKLGIKTNRAAVYKRLPFSKARKFIYKHTDNGHKLIPSFLLRSEAKTIPFGRDEFPRKQFLRRRILAVKVYNNTAVWRTLSREKYRKTVKRYEHLVNRYHLEQAKLRAAYREAAPTFYSKDFWNEHLRGAE